MPIPINYEKMTSTKITRLKCLQILPVASLLLFAFISQSMDAKANGLYMPLQQSNSGTQDSHRKESSKYLGYGGDAIHLVASKSKSFDRLTVHTASLNPRFCIQYDSILKSITVTCKFANLSQVDKVL